MAKNMVFNQGTGKMEDVSAAKAGAGTKVAIDSAAAEKLKGFALTDGYDLTGISYETEKDAAGKTKTDKDGKPVFVMVDGKKKTTEVAESAAKTNAAIAAYVNQGIKMLIAHRESVQNATE